MKLFKKDKKPIENVQLSTRHIALRWIAVAVCLIVAVVTIGFALNSMLTVNAGWQVIEDISTEITCAADFVVNYDFGEGGADATTAYRRIAALYSDAAEKAYWLFTKDQTHETIVGVRAINDQPNTKLTVDPVLYNAFAKVVQSGDRSIYLAPLYSEHDSMLACETDAHAAMRDPARDHEAADFAMRVAQYAGDPQHVNVELLGNNQLMLHVSDEYLNWANANALDALVDFHWMKNAFIVDYFADVLTQNGFTNGTISSEDGFIRNLGAQDTFLFNVYDRPDDVAYLAGAMQYRGKKSIVSLRSFPVSADDAVERYYVYADGSPVAPQMSPEDGMRKHAVPAMIGYVEDKGCADVLLSLLPVYVQDEMMPAGVKQLANSGVQTIWCEDGVIVHTEASLRMTNLYTDESMSYQTKVFE